MITFLASQFKPLNIKVAFAALIGKVGASAQTVFYLLPSQRAKLVESFLELVFNEKSMLVDTVKKPFDLGQSAAFERQARLTSLSG
jgi:hypothetical protein